MDLVYVGMKSGQIELKEGFMGKRIWGREGFQRKNGEHSD